jgi:hypothetical protein
MNEELKAIELYQDAYERWCHELSHDKNKLKAKNIAEYICNQLIQLSKEYQLIAREKYYLRVKEQIQQL